ncbi:hypothetical protein AB8U03_10495 [Clostridium sp. Mt-5]|uniref:4Fe-4S ferredoxin-type domain-containing protein n=1 Tax=Clostridium moutaii TaxID=3240932 RepID=A0ABV4BPC1_9CLOT
MGDLGFTLKKELFKSGASMVKFADLRDVEESRLNKMTYGISIAVALNPFIICNIGDGPTKEYHEEYNRVNNKLDTLVEHAGQILQSAGYNTLLKTTSKVEVNWESLYTTLPHKTVATRAGMGWIGKCALLVTKEFGSAVRFSSLLTDAKLKTEIPIDKSYCGNCHICKDFCPAGAPLGINWRIGFKRENFFDAFKCKNMADKICKAKGIKDTICGKCIEVCPWTKKYLRKRGL